MAAERRNSIRKGYEMSNRAIELLLPQKTVLLLIDVQKGFDDPLWGERNNPQAEENIARLLEHWRKTGRPVFHVQHLSRLPLSPLNPGHPGHELKDMAKPAEGEPLFQKHVNSAFIGTKLEEKLHEVGCEALIITGLTTPHCVSTTARMAGNLGFQNFCCLGCNRGFRANGPRWPEVFCRRNSLGYSGNPARRVCNHCGYRDVAWRGAITDSASGTWLQNRKGCNPLPDPWEL